MPKVFVAGHHGMVGSAIVRQLERTSDCELVLKSKAELDLLDQAAVLHFFGDEKIDQVYLAAARVGGIYANSNNPAEFIHDNLVIQSNVIHAAFLHQVEKLLFLGSSCIFPRSANQPMSETDLMTGPLEETNEAYAIAKIAGLKLCESYSAQYGQSHNISYRAVMPTNLYGPGDNYHSVNSHVIPGLIRRFHEAKTALRNEVIVWGSGSPLREFLYVDDMAKACVHVMNIDDLKYQAATQDGRNFLNVGSGVEISIAELAGLIKEVVGFEGDLRFDRSYPDGTPRKLLDSTKLNNLGWKAEMGLLQGLKISYSKYLRRQELRQS